MSFSQHGSTRLGPAEPLPYPQKRNPGVLTFLNLKLALRRKSYSQSRERYESPGMGSG